MQQSQDPPLTVKNPSCDDCGEPTSHFKTTRCTACAAEILLSISPHDDPPEDTYPEPTEDDAKHAATSTQPHDDEFPPPPDFF